MSRTRGGGRHLDEDDIRVRARGGSRPRTRKRPKHEDAREGLVTAVDRGRYRCLVDGVPVVAMKARELGRGSIVVGDRVDVVGDLSGRPDTLARVVRVRERASVLRRTADDTDPVERVIVANADQLAIVCALADPAPQPRFVDRCLVAAYAAGLEPLLCLTKADLASPDEMLAIYRPLGLPYEVLEPDEGLEELRSRLAGRTTVFVGSSGVGKSTLVNRLVPGTDRAVGHVNAVTGRGRHTSTSALALEFEGGWLIDTPGVRSFGLAHIGPEEIVRGFHDLDEFAADCPPDCTHQADAPDCAIGAALDRGEADPDRVASLRRLLSSREGEDDSEPAPQSPTP
ncbi:MULTISPECIES: ribosome small subunit-dependent GTPase A [Nocardiopsis]|uniref:Small ribosomal subunit biogenesis GTPase RsgA n=2 Tax=Nocardiopsis alba TaxID=53437 RepID=A0A7K2IQB9_9ACTN|nr:MULTISPECIES: ribosome small subunit-dependent GTPase A [Nocardiopsis]AFR07692.1 ribosome small subunit-dependent GTPase A [Nocardiopsis alba ATCC BAA-2165]MEC3893071.1 ribosome small subunit-dependent GTPase A [Nocardiopsis sp. LDBS1602]MYR32027.1 ribosome small subunit-dependent GTPase A [Nocardiopsis alba]